MMMQTPGGGVDVSAQNSYHAYSTITPALVLIGNTHNSVPYHGAYTCT